MEPTTLALLFVAATNLVNATATYPIPEGLVSGLCYQESKHKIAAVHPDDGDSESLGICQIKLETARYLGFKGTRAELMRPKTNIFYATKYLSKQFKRYHGALTKSVAAYNSGSYIVSHKTGYAVNRNYVDKVLRYWKEGR